LKKKILMAASYVLVAALSSFLTLGLQFALGSPGSSKLSELSQLIQQRYVETPDMTALEDAAASAMIHATGDRWSYYISAADYESHLEQMENAYVGVGITIQAAENDAGFLVIAVAEGGPAQEAGLLPGDLLIAVEDQDIRGWSTEEVRGVVKGKEGTSVQLTILRQGDHRSFTVERRQVLTPVADYEMLEGNVGLVTIYNFDRRCAQETIGAIEALLENGAEKLIFDVRHNPGGYASEMVKVLDYLLPEGDLFRMVDNQGKETVDRSGPEFLELPMAVLVNGGSYSAAEFFAAALREYDAAVILGEQTSGKGYYQNTFRLSDGSAAALSVGKYFTPQGKNLEGVGITPDIKIEVDEETASAIYYGTLETGKDPYVLQALRAIDN
jgi:carboxyl-terminal processing protease